MPQKHWKAHGRQLWLECEKIWVWLRTLLEYRKNYRTMKRTHPRPYEIPPGSTIFTAPDQPEDKFVENLKKRWGFYPLINPAKRYLPVELFRRISEFLCAGYNEAGVRHAGFGYMHFMEWNEKYGLQPKKELPLLPNRISFEIDPQLPINPTLKYIKEFLKTVQAVYKRRPKRPHADKVCPRYKAYVMLQLGKSEREISRSLSPSLKKEFPNSYRQTIDRIIEEVKYMSQ